ncbi:Gfo/Idh/MocA family oxidoreductase [Candidatus Poribacteria bacterium]|nr:Gfo/Idh/MocA family oxidoreductase [Candidatus Poribacteria bacterium]
MAEKLGVGIIGCGAVSRVHARAWNTFPQDCEIIAVCDTDQRAVHRWLQDFEAQTIYTDHHELLADKGIDVVSVCVPNYLHAPIAIAAAKAGKHVIVEKPMAMNVAEAEQMIAAARQHHTKLAVVFQRRVEPQLRFIKERVVPEIGEIEFSYLIDSHFRGEEYYERSSNKWRGKQKIAGGGVFVDQAIHTWDIFQWYHGGVDIAYGYWTNLLHPSIEVEDIGYGLVQFVRGSYGKLLTTSCCHLPSGIGGMRIFGTKGEITGSDFSLQNQLLEARLKDEMAYVVENTRYTGHTAQIQDLIGAIREDREPEVSGDTAKESLKIINGIHDYGRGYTEGFRKWALDNFEMPEPLHEDKPTAEDAEDQDWRGGGLIEKLAGIVKSRERRLDAPFR